MSESKRARTKRDTRATKQPRLHVTRDQLLGIAKRLRAILLERGIKHGVLAEAVGVRPETISNIVNAKRPPDLATIYAIADKLKVSVAAILEDTSQVVKADGETHQQSPPRVEISAQTLSDALVLAFGRLGATAINRPTVEQVIEAKGRRRIAERQAAQSEGDVSATGTAGARQNRRR